MTQISPDTVTFTRVETYRGPSCWQAIWSFLKAKRTGSIELHCSQGAVAVVQFKENEKREIGLKGASNVEHTSNSSGSIRTASHS